MKGLFIALEGLDGSGGSTQARMLAEALAAKGREVLTVSYPNPDSPIGGLIYEYLDRKHEFSPGVQAALYIADFALDRERIAEALAAGKVVLANRYFFSTLAYQCGAKGFPKDDALRMAEALRIPVPDLVVLVDISPQTSMRRKFGENRKLDRHEEDTPLLAAVREVYTQLAKDGVFAREWAVVDGERSIEEVAADVRNAVLGRLE